MKKILLIMLVTISGSLFAEITLDECLQEARVNSKKIESVQYQISSGDAMSKLYLSNLLPQFDLDGRYELKNEGRGYSVFTEYGSAFSTKNFAVNAHMLLFDFFSSWNQYKSSKSEAVIFQKNLEQAYVKLDEEVKFAFFNILEMENSASVLEDSINRLEKQLLSAQDFLHQGNLSKADLISLKMQLIELRKSLMQSNGNILQSKMYLNRLLGRDPLAQLKLKEPVIETYPQDFLENLQKNALENRQDLKILKEKVKSLNYQLKSARQAYAPKFSLFGNYSHLFDPPPSYDSSKTDNNWISGGIGVNFSLYDGGHNKAKMQKIKSEIAQTKADIEDLEREIMLDISKLFVQSNEIKDNISIDDDIIKLTEEKFNYNVEKYHQGLISMDDLLKAEQNFIQAKLNKNKTIYSFHKNHAKMISALGGSY